jgi:hypothetical protein
VETLEKIRAMANIKVTTIYQILLANKGYLLEWNRGCLEIHFENGQLLFLTVAPNGSSPLVRHSAWKDPFAGELDESTQLLISQGGRDIKVDVSTIYPFTEFLNHTIDRVYPLYYKDNESLCGVQIISGSTVLNLYYRCDIAWGEDNPNLIANDLHVGKE